MGGDDNTDSSEKYNVGGDDNAESSEEYNSDSSSESPTPQLNKKTHGKLNSDKVPKAMMYTTTHYDDETVEIAKHREIFMDRAFSEVDSMNKTVKRVLQAQLAERRLRGEDPNWTEILGSVASCVNSQCGRGKYEETSYKAVMLEERIDMS